MTIDSNCKKGLSVRYFGTRAVLTCALLTCLDVAATATASQNHARVFSEQHLLASSNEANRQRTGSLQSRVIGEIRQILRRYSFNSVAVAMDKAQVSLIGFIPSANERLLLELTVGAVKGVKSVNTEALWTVNKSAVVNW